MRVIHALRQRFEDWTRERRITRLRADAFRAIAAVGIVAAEPKCRALFDECDRRSPAQVERMTRDALARMDPHARAVFERSDRA
jgi:hypothetical protein